MQPVPSSSYVKETQYRVSVNYSNNFSGLVNAEEDIRVGSGVVKRVGWRKLPKFQIGKPLNYSITRTKLNYPESYNFYQRSANPTDMYYQYLREVLFSRYNPYDYRDLAHIDNALYKAKARLFDSLKGEGTNIANIIAERKQTIQLVGDTIMRVVWVIKDLKRGDIASATRRLFGDSQHGQKIARKLRGKDIANQWIGLQYGWLPLLDDVYGLVNLTHKRTSSGVFVFRESAKSWGYSSPGTLSSLQTTKNGVQYYRPYEKQHNWVRQKYMIRARPNWTLAEPAALGLTNPLVPLWEVVPWSFVVDWFLPVGTYLEQLTADHGWTFLDGCLSTHERYSWAQDHTSDGTTSWSGIPIWYANYCRGDARVDKFVRSTLSGFPSVSAPRFKNPLSVGHVKNALALLTQVVYGGRKYR